MEKALDEELLEVLNRLLDSVAQRVEDLGVSKEQSAVFFQAVNDAANDWEVEYARGSGAAELMIVGFSLITLLSTNVTNRDKTQDQ
jgi:hypothetical protein